MNEKKLLKQIFASFLVEQKLAVIVYSHQLRIFASAPPCLACVSHQQGALYDRVHERLNILTLEPVLVKYMEAYCVLSYENIYILDLLTVHEARKTRVMDNPTGMLV